MFIIVIFLQFTVLIDVYVYEIMKTKTSTQMGFETTKTDGTH